MQKRVLPLVAVALAATAPAQAQSPVHFEVTPHFGVYSPLNAMGAAAVANSAWYIRLDRMDAAPMFELSAEVGWPSRTVSTRARGMVTLPAEATGMFECYPGLACPSVLLPATASIDVMAAMVDVVYSPFAASSVRPYAMLGTGLRRYHIEWPAAAVLIDEGVRTETTLAVHAGIGTEVDVPIGSLRVELAAYRSPRGDLLVPPPGTGGFAAEGRRAQNDVAMTIGWQILRF